MSKNDNLRVAKSEKQDEFYTQLVDIEKELKHYKKHFKDKIVFCNCDDPYESNFFKYFAMNFNYLGLKKLICTCYDNSPIAYTQLSFLENEKQIPNKNRKAYKIEITEVEDYNKDGAVDLADVEYLVRNKKNTLTLLKGDGDFRSEECIELLKQCDIVVTNPPFSLFRDYIVQLVESNKKFIILGNQNAITYREIFPYLKDNIFWLGYNAGAQTFEVPFHFERSNTYVENGKKYAKFGNICWFTNLSTTKRNESLICYKNYSENQYDEYINFDAIDISKISDIPIDYYGAMGVPVTFMDKYNPEQFEILGIDGGDMGVSYGVGVNLTKEECNALFKEHKGFRRGKLCYRDKNGELQVCYRRILIKRK
ncbi:MAG: adenine-specific methyltransferase EcoRI family protein [Clostridia bacterium]|nr:adenine-specific methyltransferase EcoRI family protein [Clostridia bacterium]